MSEARTYGGWQQERVAFVFGLSGRQSVLLAGAVVAVVIPLLSQRISQAAVWWPAGLLLAGVALVRAQGRTADQWALTASSYAAIRAQGAHRFAGGPYLAPAARDAGQDVVQLELPGILAGRSRALTRSGRRPGREPRRACPPGRAGTARRAHGGRG